MDKKIINTAEAASILGVSVNTVRIWRTKENRGPKYFTRGYNRYFYYEQDVIDFGKKLGFINA